MMAETTKQLKNGKFVMLIIYRQKKNSYCWRILMPHNVCLRLYHIYTFSISTNQPEKKGQKQYSDISET